MEIVEDKSGQHFFFIGKKCQVVGYELKKPGTEKPNDLLLMLKNQYMHFHETNLRSQSQDVPILILKTSSWNRGKPTIIQGGFYDGSIILSVNQTTLTRISKHSHRVNVIKANSLENLMFTGTDNGCMFVWNIYRDED